MVARKCWKRCARCRSWPMSATDLLASAPQIKITINRDQASRFGISPQAIDDTLNDAFGQRQITQYFTQLNTYSDHSGDSAGAAEGPRLARTCSM